jgi:hypothetical protein
MHRLLVIGLTFAAGVMLDMASSRGGAFNFQEPADWTVGDAGSTYQNWEASIEQPFAAVNSLPTASNVNPAIGSDAKMTVQSPGFVAGSGGYYSPTGPYRVLTSVYNHGGSFGSGGIYASGYGTRVIVQTAATTNPEFDASVFEDSIELLTLSNAPLVGGTNADLIGVTELFRQEVETPFGLADQQELLFEFYLPAYSGDFRVRFQAAMHSSFQELRIDTLLVEESEIDGDFNGDGDVDGEDLADWQASYGIDALADADGDGDTDGRDFLVWQRNYTGSGTLLDSAFPPEFTRRGGPSALVIPEPTSLMVVIFGIIMGLDIRSVITRASR